MYTTDVYGTSTLKVFKGLNKILKIKERKE
jgi:hypothetical protein